MKTEIIEKIDKIDVVLSIVYNFQQKCPFEVYQLRNSLAGSCSTNFQSHKSSCLVNTSLQQTSRRVQVDRKRKVLMWKRRGYWDLCSPAKQFPPTIARQGGDEKLERRAPRLLQFLRQRASPSVYSADEHRGKVLLVASLWLVHTRCDHLIHEPFFFFFKLFFVFSNCFWRDNEWKSNKAAVQRFVACSYVFPPPSAARLVIRRSTSLNKATTLDFK